MNKVRIEVFSQEEAQGIINKFKKIFDVNEVSKLYKHRDKEGYYIYLSINEKDTKNERGAGRKDRFTDQEKEMIKMYRFQGQTLNELAKSFNCSVGLIHKIINS